MRRFILIAAMLGWCVSTYSQISLYSDHTVRKICHSIYDHVKIYYPDDEIAVSYSLENTDFIDLLKSNTADHLEINASRIASTDLQPVDDQFADMLCEIFSEHNRHTVTPMYELRFTFLQYDLIACALCPYGEKHLLDSGKFYVFVFGFDRSGNIDYMSRTSLNIRTAAVEMKSR